MVFDSLVDIEAVGVGYLPLLVWVFVVLQPPNTGNLIAFDVSVDVRIPQQVSKPT